MNDNPLNVAVMVNRWYEKARLDKRFQIAKEMYEMERTKMLSSLPKGLPRYERRLVYRENVPQ